MNTYVAIFFTVIFIWYNPDMEFTVMFSEAIDGKTSLCGGKGASLAKLYQNGFGVVLILELIFTKIKKNEKK